jgi:hypothetical protein
MAFEWLIAFLNWLISLLSYDQMTGLNIDTEGLLALMREGEKNGEKMV